MNSFKKIIQTIIACSVILSFSLILNHCSPEVPTEEVSEETKNPDYESAYALDEFWDTLDCYMVSVDKEETLWQEYNVLLNKVNAIQDEGVGLTISEKEKIRKLSQEGLGIVEKEQEMLDEIRENIYYRSGIISELQGNVVKITDLSKNLLAQEIADKLREINDLKIEELSLYDKNLRHSLTSFKLSLFVAQGKMSMEEANKEQKMLNDDIDNNNSRIYEVSNTINAFIG